jgi:hypothetical protein
MTVSRNRRAVVLAIVFLVLGMACRATSNYPLPDGLTLRVSLPQDGFVIGSDAFVEYEVTNHSAHIASGCFTFTRGYDLWGSENVSQNVDGRDHPMCVSSFELPPGASIRWEVEVEVGDIGVGGGAYSGWVQLAVPSSCDAYGCDRSVLRAEKQPVSISVKP